MASKGKGSGGLPPQATTSRPQTSGKGGGSGKAVTKQTSGSARPAGKGGAPVYPPRTK
jgi:hypothetical protein